MDKVAQSSEVSGAQRMRARDVGLSGSAAQPVAPSARDMAARGAGSIRAWGPSATSRDNVAAAPLGNMGTVPDTSQWGAPSTSQRMVQQSQGQQAVAQPAWQYNPNAAQVTTPTQVGEDSYEVWTGPHQYSGQPVDMKWVISLQTGGKWQPTQELRAHQGQGT